MESVITDVDLVDTSTGERWPAAPYKGDIFYGMAMVAEKPSYWTPFRRYEVSKAAKGDMDRQAPNSRYCLLRDLGVPTGMFRSIPLIVRED